MLDIQFFCRIESIRKTGRLAFINDVLLGKFFQSTLHRISIRQKGVWPLLKCPTNVLCPQVIHRHKGSWWKERQNAAITVCLTATAALALTLFRRVFQSQTWKKGPSRDKFHQKMWCSHFLLPPLPCQMFYLFLFCSTKIGEFSDMTKFFWEHCFSST